MRIKPKRGGHVNGTWIAVFSIPRRNVVECSVGWLKECRSLATRFEKLAVNYLQMVKLAFIERYLHLLAL